MGERSGDLPTMFVNQKIFFTVSLSQVSNRCVRVYA